MLITEQLKRVDWLRRLVKKHKIWKEYFHDARLFCKYYMEECDRRGDNEYRMLMFVHNLEKGMCMPEPRPFGHKKIISLMEMITRYENMGKSHSSSVYNMSIAIIQQWVNFYVEHGWEDDTIFHQAKNFLDKYGVNFADQAVGYTILKKDQLYVSQNCPFDNVIKSRRSVRTFLNKSLSEEDVLECIELANSAPTACNRQMVGIVQVENRELCDLITNTIYGAGGLSADTVTYFVITYDIRAFDYYGERNQGYFNAGLVAMNFVNALHSRGIGSCFLQWANNAEEDCFVRRRLNIPENERIAVVVAAGYYPEEMYVAKSMRKNVNEILRKI